MSLYCCVAKQKKCLSKRLLQCDNCMCNMHELSAVQMSATHASCIIVCCAIACNNCMLYICNTSCNHCQLFNCHSHILSVQCMLMCMHMHSKCICCCVHAYDVCMHVQATCVVSICLGLYQTPMAQNCVANQPKCAVATPLLNHTCV